MDRKVGRCTCSNAPNCTWGHHGFIEATSEAPVTPERLKLYEEHERLGLPHYQSKEAARQTEVFQQLVHL